VPDKNPREISKWIMHDLEIKENEIEKTNSNL
jgi:hypothetical protein